VLEAHVAGGTTPGAVAAIVRRDGVLARLAVGRHTYASDSPRVEVDTIYDLASLTKIIATTAVCMSLHGEGTLDLEDQVSDVVPSFSGEGRERVTVRQLLAHCSGLPAHVRFFETCGSKDEVLDAVCRTPLKYEPTTEMVYSDLGFVLLGVVLARLTGTPLEQLVRDRVTGPLGMRETDYLPREELLHRIPPTEEDENWRKRLIHGEVHDNNAAAMGGIAPHAGLFGTVDDLALFLRTMLRGGELGGREHYNPASVKLFSRREGTVAGSSRALGWDTPSETGSSAGSHFGADSFGHTGFTGTSMWADPAGDLGVVLLTNRVHPTRENDGIRQLRPEFHDAVSASMI
jgi:serine-type D-Ala-D-Ala carboxypeptidase